jgi:hypothetical protein
MIATRTAPAPRREIGALRICERYLAAQLRAIEDRLGTEALGVVDLPPLGDGGVEPAQLLGVPPLLWAREVEATGLVEFFDALASGTARLAIVLPIGDVARQLMEYWRARDDRLGVAERRAVYSLVFGGPGSPTPNDAFPELFARLVAALSELARLSALQQPGVWQTRVSSVAYELAVNLSSRATGIVAFATRDAVAQISSALKILATPELSNALGGGGPWAILRRFGPDVLGRPLRPERHVARAEAGLAILGWIAQRGAAFAHTTEAPPPSILAAAERWGVEGAA